MKTLVTGGAGFIGSNLTKALVELGHEVWVLDDLSSGFFGNLEGTGIAGFIQGDVRDEAVVSKSVADAEVVFHLAASVGNQRSINDPIRDSEINVLGTLRMLEASRRAEVRKVVFSSSAGIFGELKQLPIREDHPVEPDSPYGASKLAAEKLCLAYAKLFEVEAIALRYFNVYGPNQRYDAYGNVIPIFAHRLLGHLPLVVFGDGEQTRDFVNVKDVVQANLLASAARGVSGAFNIGSGSSVTINELARLMFEVAGTPARVEYAPPRKGDVRHSRADIASASEALGFVPTIDIKEGLREYLAWAKSAVI